VHVTLSDSCRDSRGVPSARPFPLRVADVAVADQDRRAYQHAGGRRPRPSPLRYRLMVHSAVVHQKPLNVASAGKEHSSGIAGELGRRFCRESELARVIAADTGIASVDRRLCSEASDCVLDGAEMSAVSPVGKLHPPKILELDAAIRLRAQSPVLMRDPPPQHVGVRRRRRG